MDTMMRTPQPSPTRRVPSITQAQKRALVDNLQLEITERALRLRTQYAAQAQGLRARLDLRVNRIPHALRKRNMQELMDEYHAKSKPAPPPPVPVVVAAKQQKPETAQSSLSRAKPASKRKSDEISLGDNKENALAQSSQDIPNPKKRTKTVVTANSKATRARNAGPAGVLSPKSHNSRTLPHSPIKPMDKMYPPRPQSSAQTDSVKPTRAPSRQTKRPGAAPEADGGRASEGSNTSAGTTIVTKPGTRKAANTKKTVPARPAATSRKPAAAKLEAAPPAAGTRTLRKRN
ncbi:uncharacterized protein SEPMUDRAFT_78324 [Sphaerulina musiva SO2202]|uniref:Borealin N-terminal domain-containing protein n=1 Tax=Sphaerulina musiva (strain SO2202) TaxID=692275 RepID=N1QNG8_SPHMS|nr:uncharacterized protein SEPMUDRAFT_78324 [Sphaerulina musiva SO2202]EMF17743.1 hypothetical protein SEPMUDRAFT_78324 [Sphaerulina musiva SO2202]